MSIDLTTSHIIAVINITVGNIKCINPASILQDFLG